MMIIKNQKEHKSLGHPLATGSLRNNLKLIWENRGIDARYLLRAFNILASNLALLPFRTFEIKKWAKKIEMTIIQEPPIFILGHWRCGTTYLHNLFSRDTRFGFVTTLQAFCPDICIEGSNILRPIFKKLLPKKRPIDNMLMALDYPQEEEYALSNLYSLSFYHGYFFPRNMNSIFNRLLFKDNSAEIINQWKEMYLKVLKKATLIMNGKQLIVKNPLNLVRIPVLLEMFPNAKFVHIYRNPYIVYYSTVFTFKTMMRFYQLETVKKDEIEANVLQFYAKMMRIFWETKYLIPPENFTEVKFEDFEKNPSAAMERIYNELRLPDFEKTRDAIENYVKTQSDYQKNSYPMDPETNQAISQNWKFIIERLKYKPPANSV